MEHCDHFWRVGTLQHRLTIQGRYDKFVGTFQVIAGRHDHRAPVLSLRPDGKQATASAVGGPPADRATPAIAVARPPPYRDCGTPKTRRQADDAGTPDPERWMGSHRLIRGESCLPSRGGAIATGSWSSRPGWSC